MSEEDTREEASFPPMVRAQIVKAAEAIGLAVEASYIEGLSEAKVFKFGESMVGMTSCAGKDGEVALALSHLPSPGALPQEAKTMDDIKARAVLVFPTVESFDALFSALEELRDILVSEGQEATS